MGSYADDADDESFFGMLKRERVNRRRDRTWAEARLDTFDYILRFHNRSRRRRMERLESEEKVYFKPSVELE